MRLWVGRFAEDNDRRVADFTRSIDSTASSPRYRGLDRPRARSAAQAC